MNNIQMAKINGIALFFIVIFPALVFLACTPGERANPVSSNAGDSVKIFTLLDSTQTGIGFKNVVVDEEKFNILTYRNFYNGGGVAIGDINNDSLPDVYFTSNQRSNKLYLNKGNFVFEDITDKAGVAGKMAWSTGVTMADVNGDGRLDIYVCNSGDVDGDRRANELFINNGDLTFSEKAKDYNLNNAGYSTHAAFFDYDLDGDLDCYILNNSFKDPGKIELYKKVREVPSPRGDKLMRNDGETFTDVTTSSGIYSSEIGFGLGVAVSDLNHDHLPDIYISNDFWERDYLYMNKGDGKFSEELIDRINYSSLSSMGADIADLNGDGSPEIFTTDMLPADNERIKTTIAFDPYHLEDAKYRANFHYQMVQNCLHLNDGNANFQEIALMSGVSATDWSWGALIFDFENDGKRDIFVSNGINRDIMSMDFREFLADTEKRNEIIAKNGKYDPRAFISFMPARPLQNYAFQPGGKLMYTDHAALLGLNKPSFSNGSAYGDLDNDGDLDLVVNNINETSFIYRNGTPRSTAHHYLKVKFVGSEHNHFGIGAEVTLRIKGTLSTLQNFNTRGFESSIEPLLVFGLGDASKVDTLEVIWPDRKKQELYNVKADQTLVLDQTQADKIVKDHGSEVGELFADVTTKVIPGEAVHHENSINDFDNEILLTRMLSTEGPRLIKGDVNGDKLEDLILLGAAGDGNKLLIQSANGNFIFKTTAAFLRDKAFESTCGALFDHDGDGDADLMIGSGGNEPGVPRENFLVRLYKNDGRGNFKMDPTGVPAIVGNFSTLETEDYDQDGDIDIFLGARTVPGNYGLPAQSYLLNNDHGNWMNVAPPTLGNIGMVTDASWSDFDGDGDKDLIVVGDWMAITMFRNDNGVVETATTVPQSAGWYNRIEPADLDKDGDIDFILGNWGLNSKFKASPSRPLTMYVNDFDDNGKSEFIINWYPPLDKTPYPFATKSELVSQLPALRKSILKYSDYAPKTYDSLFSAEIRKRSIPYEANYLSSAILWNDGGKFSLESLPVEAQVSPVFGILADDFNGDGKMDIWLGGNFYALKPQVGRHDASKGILLVGDGKRSFTNVSHSGIFIRGEVRDAVLIPFKGTKRIVIARNNAGVKAYERRVKSE